MLSSFSRPKSHEQKRDQLAANKFKTLGADCTCGYTGAIGNAHDPACAIELAWTDAVTWANDELFMESVHSTAANMRRLTDKYGYQPATE